MKLKHIASLLLLTFFCLHVFAAPLTQEDFKWLNRIGYGINSQTVNDFQNQGKKKYLDVQLVPPQSDNLPAPINDIIAKLSVEQQDEQSIARDYHEKFKGIHKLPTDQKQTAVSARRNRSAELQNETTQRHILRALYSPWQLKEQMTWFWLNHFNIFQGKGDIRSLLADYEDNAIRVNALSKFRNLVMATLKHPAMLIYLDNTHNAAGKINENYARELMELHTLGVDGGYTQQDVQELSKILTGVGINWDNDKRHIKKDLQQYYLHDGIFEFNPNRHDFSEKHFLGQTIKGNGFAEVEQVVDMLVKHPSTAHFVSRKLAVYFVSDNPPQALVERMAKTFLATDGDIPSILRTLFESQEFTDSLGKKVSDPVHYVLSALRFAYDGQMIVQTKPIIHWLGLLNEPLFGHPTPDGYGMTQKDWISPAQVTKRFQAAKQIVNSNLTAADPKDSLKQQKLENKPLYQKIAPILSAQTKEALAKAASAQEWNIFLLSAPEFVYR